MKQFQSGWYRGTRWAAAAVAVWFGLGIVTSPAQAVCVGDCGGDGTVTVSDLVQMMSIALTLGQANTCTAGDSNGDGAIAINDIVVGVNNAINGCPPDGEAVCGNGTKDTGEDCDDGGICMGGTNAGAECTKESDCQGEGVCDALGIPGGGLRKICSADADCGGAKCVKCYPFGGDGCAANCTTETDLPNDLVAGVIDGTEIKAGTSGANVYGILNLPLPLAGKNNFIVGKEKDGRIPLAQKPEGVQLPAIAVGTIACACVRGVEYKTCGGAQYEADGETASPDCSRDATVCKDKKPCTAVAGPGNAGIGTVGCASLPSVNYTVEQDACTLLPDGTCLKGCGGKALKPDGTPATCEVDADCKPATGWPERGCLNVPQPAKFTFTGGGGKGSMLLLNASSIGTVTGLCTGNSAAYGPDKQFCTDDDAVTGTSPGTPGIQTLTTGSAASTVLNAAGELAYTIGPYETSGTPLVSCDQVSGGTTSGSTLAGAFTQTGGEVTGDIVVTNQFVAE